MKRKPRPWVKYSQRALPGRKAHAPGAVDRLQELFLPTKPRESMAELLRRMFRLDEKGPQP